MNLRDGAGFFRGVVFSALTSIDYRCILYIDNLCMKMTGRKEEENLRYG